MNDTLVDIEVSVSGEGHGLPILLLHEGLGSVAMWKDFPQRLAEATNRRTVACSRRGYGSSGDFAGPYGCDFMHREADAMAQLIDELGLGRVHVFGHSDGASIGLLLAARHPEKVASLVLEAPHVFVEDICLAAIVQLGQTARVDGMVERLSRYHRRADTVFTQWHDIWTFPAFAAWNIESEIERITAPVLLIQGEDDEYGTFAQLDSITQRLPSTRELRLANCRHSPHRDQSPAVLQATTQFLREIADA